VPPQTLAAFIDHGNPKLSLEADLDAAKNAMDDLAFCGISMKEVTRELEDQGVKSFADAFTALLESIEEKRIDQI
jgi:transaldolase